MPTVTLTEHARTWTLDVPDDVWASTVGRHIAESGRPYEWRLLERIRAIIDTCWRSPTGTVVDVGANIGNHAIYLAAVCDVDVVAFEPVTPDVVAANVAANGLTDRVRVEPVALGAQPGRASTRGINMPTGERPPDGTWEQWGYLHKLDRADDGDLEIRTLDSYDLQHVSVMKVDVEGMEPEVLAGATATLRRCKPIIFAETFGAAEHDAIAAVLAPLGYTLARRYRRGTPVEEWRCA